MIDNKIPIHSITLALMVDTGPRTWKERLFSLPWRPWIKRHLNGMKYELNSFTLTDSLEGGELRAQWGNSSIELPPLHP